MIGNIYAIVCRITGEMYIGSTSKHVEYRLEQHKSSNNKCMSKQIIDRNNYDLKVLETLTANNKTEILLRERHWLEQSRIEGGTVVNKSNPIRTEEELKTYTKDKRIEHSQKWQADYVCPCGTLCRLINKNRHEQSKEHKKYVIALELELFDL